MGARGKAGLVLLAFVSALAMTPESPRAASAREACDQVLPGCGICFPGGYDVNTVGDVGGVILEVQTPADGPVRLVVSSGPERWIVLACPTRHWVNEQYRLAPGDPISVRGSKSLGADGSLYLVAREIRPPGSAPAVVLRDRHGVPLWGGSHRGRPAGRGRRGF